MNNLLTKGALGVSSLELLQITPLPIATATEIVKLLGQAIISIYTIYVLYKTHKKKGNESSSKATGAEN